MARETGRVVARETGGIVGRDGGSNRYRPDRGSRRQRRRAVKELRGKHILVIFLL